MWYQFILQNAHFAVHIYAALVLFAVFWLHFDAWTQRRTVIGFLRSLGFLILSLSFLASASTVESVILASSILGPDTVAFTVSLLRIIGFTCLFTGQLTDPLVRKPVYAVLPGIAGAGFASTLSYQIVLVPVLTVLTGMTYLRRATVGLEDHLKPVAYSFYLLAVSEVFSLARLFRDTADLRIYNLVTPFGPMWLVENLLLLVSMIVLGKWIFGYLLKQFQTQLFMIYTWTVLAVFLLTTVTFTGLLVGSMKELAQNQIETDVKVLSYALETLKTGSESDAMAFAQNPLVLQALLDGNRKSLADLSSGYLLSKSHSSIVVLGAGGEVLARGEDSERLGDSLSSDPLVRRALGGQNASSVTTAPGVVSPGLTVAAVSPVLSADKVIGAVMVSGAVDSAFVDGIKEATGLESVVWGGDQISASTIETFSGMRLVGIREKRSFVTDTVLVRGDPYTGSVTLQNVGYIASYIPVRNLDGNPVGMLMAGRPEHSILVSAGRAIEQTFLVTVVLILFSVFPAYTISKFIAYQIE